MRHDFDSKTIRYPSAQLRVFILFNFWYAYLQSRYVSKFFSSSGLVITVWHLSKLSSGYEKD